MKEDNMNITESVNYVNNGVKITDEWKPCRLKGGNDIHQVKLNRANSLYAIPKENPYMVKHGDHWEVMDKRKFDSLFIMVTDQEEIKRSMLNTLNDNREIHETGAVRSTDANNVRYDLITPVGLRRLAETYKEGCEKYGPDNWKKGFKISGLINHAVRHINSYIDGDDTEDHLAHAVWNLMTAMHFEERMPEMQDMYEQLKLMEKRGNEKEAI